MSKKPDTASSLKGILEARRGLDTTTPEIKPEEISHQPELPANPSPALPPVRQTEATARQPKVRKLGTGKSGDKATYGQFTVYLRRDTRKKVLRALDDAETGQDFSDFVQELLEQWLKTNT